MDETSPVALYLPVEVCLFLAFPFIDEVEILHKSNGAPYVNITPKLKTYLDEKNIKNIHISISHTDTLATAIAMIEK